MRTQRSYDGLTDRERWLMEEAYNAGLEATERRNRFGKPDTPAVAWLRSTITIPTGDGGQLHGEAGSVLADVAARRFGVTKEVRNMICAAERDMANDVLVEIRDAIQGIANRIPGSTT